MPVGLLPFIYLAFISLGLPDSAIGSAWPSMSADLGAPISWVGAVTMIISAGTILSSLMSVRAVERFGTGRVTIASVVLTATALAGFSLSGEFWQLCLWAVPYGLGAGAVDSALNAYVAVHYESQHMSWLHCMWGIGASAGPVIMGQCLGVATWSAGFMVLAALQAVLAVVITLSLPLWRDRRLPEVGDDRSASASGISLLRFEGVLPVLVCFFCYSALEATCGNWAATFCVESRGIDAATAASWASLFYFGITAGRALSGFATMRVRDHNMIRIGQALITAGIALVLVPGDDRALAAGLVLLGFGCAPIYPSIIHATPARFGTDTALALTGMQMAFAYVGSLAMSPLFGVIAEAVGTWIYPAYLAVFLVVMVVAGEVLNGIMRQRRRTA